MYEKGKKQSSALSDCDSSYLFSSLNTGQTFLLKGNVSQFNDKINHVEFNVCH